MAKPTMSELEARIKVIRPRWKALRSAFKNVDFELGNLYMELGTLKREFKIITDGITQCEPHLGPSTGRKKKAMTESEAKETIKRMTTEQLAAFMAELGVD